MESIINCNKSLLVTAHAGCMNTPINSLESIEVSLNYEVDIVELDVRFTDDLLPILSHDEIKDNKKDYVKLENAFKLLCKSENILVNLDMKEIDGIINIEKLIDKYNMKNRVFLTGIELEVVEKLNTYKVEIPYFINYELDKLKMNDLNYLKDIKNKICEKNALGINLDFKFLTKELVDLFHENNKLVAVWTVDDESTMNKIINLNVDSITTNNIDILLDKIGKGKNIKR